MRQASSPESIFHAARAMTGEPREHYLLQACGGDASLRAHVDALLAADEDAGSFLAPAGDPDATIPNLAAAGSLPRATERAGQIIGRFKLLQQIGEGGFGSVW